MKRTIFFLVLTAVLAIVYSFAFSQIPRLINYQGKLTDTNGLPLNGAYDIEFIFFGSPTGNDRVWSELQSSVTVTNGLFNVLLGSVGSIGGGVEFDKPYYLGIRINYGEELIPRKQIVSAAYAMRAENANNADLLNGMDASSFLTQTSGDVQFMGTTNQKTNGGNEATAAGDYPGIAKLSKMCQDEFPGSHICTWEEYITSGALTKAIAWIVIPLFSGLDNCRFFTSHAEGYFGYTSMGLRSCSNLCSVACCK